MEDLNELKLSTNSTCAIPDVEQLAKVMRGTKYRQNWRELFELHCLLTAQDEIDAATSQIKDSREIRGHQYFQFVIGKLSHKEIGITPRPIDLAKRVEEPLQRGQKTGGQKPRVGLIAFSPECDDAIQMRIETTEDGRIALEEVSYELTAGDDDTEERVCLKALEIVWNWGESNRVNLDDDPKEPELRKLRVQQDNPEMRILSARRDAALLRIRLSHAKIGAMLPPAAFVAIRRLLLPQASIVAAPDHRHTFSVQARKDDLRIARRDASDQSFMEIVPKSSSLRTQAQTLANAVRTLFTEITNRFPEEGRPLVLGQREAAAITRSEEIL